MRRLRREWGYVGYVLIGIGLIFAFISAYISWKDPAVGLLFLVPGSFFYLTGGLLVVLAFNYKRGTKPFLTLSLLRLIFALSAMVSLIPLIRKP